MLFVKESITQAAKWIARGFFKSDLVPRTSLDELDKVERYLNKGKQLFEWIGIRVYEPERQENGDIHWHPGKNPSDKLKNIMTIGIYEGHAFLIKEINKLAKTYAKTHQNKPFKDTSKHARKEEQLSIAQKKVKVPPTVYERTFHNESQASSLAISWLEPENGQAVGHTYSSPCVGMGARGGYWELRWTGMPRNREQSSSITGAGGMDVVDVLPTGTQKSLTVKREKNYTKPQWPEQKP